MRITAILTLLPLLASSAGCGEDEASTEFAGVYEIETWTKNDGSCDEEGPSILEQQSQMMFFVRIESFLFSSYLRAQRCPNLSECQTRSADPAMVVTGGWSFADGGDSNGWTSSSFFSESTDQCTGTFESASLSSPSDGVLEIRIEQRTGVEFPLGPDGCDVERAAAAAEDRPCVSLEVIRATLSGSP
ncbi:MAG: hypothetical protein WBM48_15565 [Polyangiales bacterium]|jgi:hypothetical protein